MKHQLLSVPSVYRLLGRVINLGKDRGVYAREHVRAREGQRMLDIGCGPADILQFLPNLDYVGFDLSADYIETARRNWGGRGRFHCQRVSEESLDDHRDFDIVHASGVLHHLDDAEAERLFRLAWAALKPGGRLVTLDGCFVPRQSRIAKFLISRDRGEYVRDERGYLDIASRVFAKVTPVIREDLLAFPYTLLIMECEKPVTESS